MAFLFVLLLLLPQIFVNHGAGLPSGGRCSKVQKKTFRSPAFSLGPGEVQDRYYLMDFPAGHLGVKDFFGEVVDELGNPVPLSEVYLHHWVVLQLYVKEKRSHEHVLARHAYESLRNSSSTQAIIGGNDGICQHHTLSQFWGLGSETRHTSYAIPDPYAIAVGDPSKVPDGYEEVWELNVHAIDTRGTEDPQGCLECRCNLYNVSKDRYGRPLKEDYIGGLKCCYEGTRCRLKPGYQGSKRTLYLQYTIEWVEWDDDCVLPVRTYIFDITDSKHRDPYNKNIGCKIEYNVPVCNNQDEECIHVYKNSLVIPSGGKLIYGVAHQHAGGQGMTMHGEDGRHLCSSLASYGSGTSPGDEAGYVVGMSTCYPQSTTIQNGEELQFTSYYSSRQLHTGVMALFYLVVAEDGDYPRSWLAQSNRHAVEGLTPSFVLGIVGLAVLAFVATLVMYNLRKPSEPAYYEVLSPPA